jgi:hypothetical protein
MIWKTVAGGHQQGCICWESDRGWSSKCAGRGSTSPCGNTLSRFTLQEHNRGFTMSLQSARKSDEADKEMFDFCDNDYREQPIGEWRPQTWTGRAVGLIVYLPASFKARSVHIFNFCSHFESTSMNFCGFSKLSSSPFGAITGYLDPCPPCPHVYLFQWSLVLNSRSGSVTQWSTFGLDV